MAIIRRCSKRTYEISTEWAPASSSPDSAAKRMTSETAFCRTSGCREYTLWSSKAAL